MAYFLQVFCCCCALNAQLSSFCAGARRADAGRRPLISFVLFDFIIPFLDLYLSFLIDLFSLLILSRRCILNSTI